MLMLPWLIVGWLELVLVIAFIGYFVFMLCFNPDMRSTVIKTDHGLRNSFVNLAILAAYTGEA